MKRRILIVDDEKNTREGLRWALDSPGCEINHAADGEEASRLLAASPFDLVITDLKMPNMDGMELLDLIVKKYPRTVVIVLTGHATVETAVEAIKKGASEYIEKPINIDVLNMLVDRALMQKNLEEEDDTQRQSLQKQFEIGNILGVSPAMKNVFEKIQHVAPTRATVLIQGESGTGKEMIASAIHYNSPRKNKPFIKLNCGALTTTLLESELFGHERGAFTDAQRQKVGRFELADGGTLFLDEISETSQEFQVKLLRVLQEQEFERVGGVKTIRVDVRVIAATNQNLKERVQAGVFREDLFYRLNVIQITVPPLRERIEDIPILANHFLKEFAEEYNKPNLVMPAQTIAQLQNFSWPGNVRQLRNVIEGLVVMATGNEIAPAHLPEEIRQIPSLDDSLSIKPGISIAEMEKRLIESTLLAENGNKAKAARILGMGRKTLYRKLQEYGING